MKFKLLLVLIIAAVSFGPTTSTLMAQKSTCNEAITIDPLIFLLNDLLPVKYEKKLSPTNSYTIGGLLAYRSTSNGSFLGFGINGSYRWYFDMFKTRQKNLQGFSYGLKASLLYLSFSGKHNVPDKNSTIGTLGGEAMYKWVWDSFVFETGIELNFPIFNTNEAFVYKPFGLSAAIGYGW